MHDDRGSIGIGILRDLRGAQRHQSVSSPRGRIPRVLLTGHRRQLSGEALQRSRHDRPLGCRQLRLQAEPAVLVEPPPRHRPSAFGLDHLVARDAHREIGPAPDGRTRHLLRPSHEITFGLVRREPGELDHLVDAQGAPLQRLGDPWESLEGVGGRDPPVSLPRRDAVTHAEPVRGVTRPGPAPPLGPIELADQRQQVTLRSRDRLMGRIEGGDQAAARGSLFHDRAIDEHGFDAMRTSTTIP